jgi:hypothetical protein
MHVSAQVLDTLKAVLPQHPRREPGARPVLTIHHDAAVACGGNLVNALANCTEWQVNGGRDVTRVVLLAGSHVENRRRVPGADVGNQLVGLHRIIRAGGSA